MLQNVNEKRTSINFNGSTVPVIPAETKLNTKVSDSLAGDVATYNTDEYNTTVITEDKSLENNFLSLKEISNTLNSHLNKYGFSIKEENVESVLIEVFGYLPLDIKTLSSEKLNNDVNSYILPALEKNKNNTKGSLEDVLQQAKDWHIAIKQGKWSSIEEYEQAQQRAISEHGKPEGIIERINRATSYNITCTSDRSVIESAITAYVECVVRWAQEVNDPTSYITRDLVRLINNTEDDNVRGIFFDVIDQMSQNENLNNLKNYNKAEVSLNTIYATVRSYRNIDKRSEDIANHNVVTTVASLNSDGEKTATTIAYLAENITRETDARAFNRQIDEIIIPFWEENKDALNSISQKIEAGKNGIELKLTAEEQEVYEEFQNKCVALRAGQNIGFANNENIPPEIKILLFNEIQVADTDKELLRRESLAYTQHLIQENPDIINMSTEDFEKFMDEATNGEYSKALDDLNNNPNKSLNSTELCDSKESSSNLGSNNISSSAVYQYATVEQTTTGALGFKQMTKTQPEIQANINEQEKTDSTDNRSSENEIKTVEDIFKRGDLFKNISSFIKRNGLLTACIGLLNSDNKQCQDFGARQLVDHLSDSALMVAFKTVNSLEGKFAFMKEASIGLLNKLETSDSFTEEIKERVIEKKQKYNNEIYC